MVSGSDRPELNAFLDHICIAFKYGGPSEHNSVGLLVRIESLSTPLTQKSGISIDSFVPEGIYFLRIETFCEVLSVNIEGNDSVDNYYVFKVLCLQKEELMSLKVLCRRFIERNQRQPVLVPYGLDALSYNPFDLNTMDWVNGQNGAGTTCATFVMAFFKILQIELFEPFWPLRLGDVEFHKGVISSLERIFSSKFRHYGPSKDFLKRQRKLAGVASRYRPEDVVNAVKQNELPMSQAKADVLNQELIQCLSCLDG